MSFFNVGILPGRSGWIGSPWRAQSTLVKSTFGRCLFETIEASFDRDEPFVLTSSKSTTLACAGARPRSSPHANQHYAAQSSFRNRRRKASYEADEPSRSEPRADSGYRVHGPDTVSGLVCFCRRASRPASNSSGRGGQPRM